MKKGKIYLCSLICVITFFVMLVFGCSSIKAYDEYVSSKIISMTQAERDEEITEQNIDKTNRLVVKTQEKIDLMGAVDYVFDEGYYILQYRNVEDTEKAYDYYKSLEYVEGVEVDVIVKADTTASSFSYYTWGAKYMGVGNYSDYLVQINDSNNMKEVVIAVLDSGIDTDHQWFVNRIANGGKNFSSSTVSSGYEYEDRKGHGTHVSGIIVDLTLENVKILPIKVLNDEGKGSVTATIEAIKYVISLKEKGTNIVAMNMSLGGELAIGNTLHTQYTQVVQSAYNAGIITIVAAGNESDNVVNYAPANISQALTVSAVAESYDANLNRVLTFASFSNYGSYVDVTAPGQNIHSAWIGGNLDYKHGTSMATPHVTALVALLVSDCSRSYTVSQIESLLIDTAIDLGTTGWDRKFGYGLVNLEKAYVEKIDDVSFSNTNKIHSQPFDLSLSSDEEGAIIYYTTDGREPTIDNGNIYNSPINIYKTTKVKAASYVFYKDRVIKQSDTKSYSYYFDGLDLEESYNISSSGEIISYTGELESLFVPRTINGITVTKIGEGAFKNSQLTRIVLPNTVTEIKDNAFENVKSLTEIVAPSVISVGDNAFKNCSGLIQINEDHFPKLQSVGAYGFYGCRGLIKVNFPKLLSVGEYGFYGCSNLETFTSPMVETIFKYAFTNNNKLKVIDSQNIKVLGTVASNEIVGSVFGNCYSLEELYLPNVEVMGNSLFSNSAIKKLVVGDKLNAINNPFPNNSQITVYGYKSTLIEEFCNESENDFVIIERLKIVTDLLDETIINNMSENMFLDVEVEGYLLSYKWFEEDSKGKFVELSNNEEKFTIGSSNNNKRYFVRITDWEGNYVDSNITTVIYTEKNVYYINSTVSGYGSVYPSLNAAVIEDESIYIKFFPDTGYEVKMILIDGIALSNDAMNYAINNGYTFTSVNENHNVEVTYGKKIYTIEYSRVIEGITSAEKINIEHGNSLTISIEPEEHYHVEMIMVGSYYLTYSQMISAISKGYLFENVSSNQQIKVIFAIDKFEITVDQNGNITKYEKKYGDDYKFNFISVEGYYIKEVIIDESNLNEEEIVLFEQEGLVFTKVDCNHYVKITLEKYKYIVEAIAYENGNITPSGENVVEYGSDLNFNFTPDEGYQISKIMLDGNELTGTNFEDAIISGYKISDIKRNYRIEVSFEIKKLVIEAKVVGNGSISPSGNVIVEYGQSQKFIITTEVHYHVENIFIGRVSLTNYQIEEALEEGYVFGNVTDNNSITIEIKIDTYIINAESDENGKIIPSGQIIKDYGSSQSLSFVPNEGYEVEKILVDGKELDEGAMQNAIRHGYLFDKIDKQHDIEVIYKLKTYSVEVVVTGDGRVNENKSLVLTHGESIKFTFVAFENNKLTKLIVNKNEISEDQLKIIEENGYEIVNINKDYIIEVIFDKITYIVETLVDGAATIYPSGNVAVKYGESQTFILSVEENSSVSHIYINNIALSKKEIERVLNEGYTFTDVKSNKSIRVIVSEKILNISSSSEGNGFISPQGNIQVKYNQSQRFRFFPVKGYAVKSIIVDGEALEEELEIVLNDGYLFENITENHSIFVVFERIQYIINANAVGGGSISPSGFIIVDSNEDKELLFEANEGYYIKDVIVDDMSKGVLESYQFVNISKNHSVKVIYEIMTFNVSVTIQGDGNVDCEDSLENIPYGENRELTVIPSKNREIKEMFIDGEQVEPKENIKLENINKDLEIKIVFEKKTTNNDSEENGGVGCSKQDSGNIGDLLFIMLGILVVVFPRKRLFKI